MRELLAGEPSAQGGSVEALDLGRRYRVVVNGITRELVARTAPDLGYSLGPRMRVHMVPAARAGCFYLLLRR